MENRPAARFALCAATVLALAVSPTAASAQAVAPAGMGSLALAKSDAILGGSSRLAAILAEQGGRPAPVAAPLEPATGGLTPTNQSILRNAVLYSPAVASGRPDVFGTVALKVGRTSLDRRWRAVENSGVGGAAASFAASLRGQSPVGRAEAINRYVNRRVNFVDDRVQYGRNDLWSAAADTLRRGRGDCEDYAIAKLQMLRAAGIADRDLYLVILKDLVRRSDHAVLVVRAGGRMLVLDNGTDVIADTETVRDYRPILTFAASGTWTHGYRRSLAPLTIAAAAPVTPAPILPAAR